MRAVLVSTRARRSARTSDPVPWYYFSEKVAVIKPVMDVQETPLEKARRVRREMHERGEQVIKLNPLAKLVGNPKSLRLAVNAICYQCMGGGADPGWQWSVGNCTSGNCGLYAVRPYQAWKGRHRPKGLGGAFEPDVEEVALVE